MKRIDEKVKDIVDVRIHASVSNFTADPLQTLAGYHFTDVTSAMMGKWISAVSRVTPSLGSNMALAGFRGVGKSHFLATFGALLAHPEYRTRVTDPLILSESQNLSRKSYPVAFLRRGTHPTVLAELKDAVAPIIGCDAASLSDSLNEILSRARECAGEMPLVLLIDTAFERGSRVVRDDGRILADIAERSKALGIFVGVALDDDIASADGINSAISQSFSIDYLDQEHLYKIVDSHIFPKQARMRSLLHDIYEYYRSAVPGFRWSEERFRSLYPLHPSIMEIAPFVRLYLHEFALLSFASEAGSRILGRPANSLIAPDEVFDNAESSLRDIESLQEAFRAFDTINTEVVAKIPVMKRLQAKLILKGLFLFSLNDEGATAAEIGASMLIFDEQDPAGEVKRVEELMTSFAEALPDQIRMLEDSDGKNRFAFKLDVKDGLKTILREAAAGVSDDVVSSILRKHVEDRYSDCSFAASDADRDGSSSDCALVWRGGLRKGRVVWNFGGEAEPTATENDGLEWIAMIETPESAKKRDRTAFELPVVSWCPSPLKEDELISIKSFHLLVSDPEIREEFDDYLAAAAQSHAVAIDKIFQRAFVEEGVLSIEGFEYNLTEEARTAQSHSQIFSIMLEPLFEGRFPLHPYFPLIIEMKGVSTLVTGLFGGADSKLDEVQLLAERFGLPLGIVVNLNGTYVAADADHLRSLPLVNEILSARKADQDDVLTLDTVFRKLSAAPYGLVREAGYLILAAMVSARLLEFVTSNGDRINQRSLDLRLIWNDIIGVATPGDSGYSSERLVLWAKLLTGKNELKGFDEADDRAAVVEALREWLARWGERRLAERFDEISDELLNAKFWRLSRKAVKAFRIVADAISAVLDDSLSVDEGLRRIADAFSDSELEFAKLCDESTTVEDYIVNASLRKEISAWACRAEFTGVNELDHLRLEVERAAKGDLAQTSALANVELGNVWSKFKRAFTDHFVEKHDASLRGYGLKEKLDEILKTDVWWEFENLCDVPGFDPTFRKMSGQIVRRIRNLNCHFATRELLDIAPACGCEFRLADVQSIEALPHDLWNVVNQAIIAFRKDIRDNKDEVIEELNNISKFEASETELAVIRELTALLADSREFRRLTNPEIRLIKRAVSKLDGRIGKGRETGLSSMEPNPFSEAGRELDALLESIPG